MTRYSASGTRVSALVGRAVKAQLAASPACDSSSARDVGSMSLKFVSSARLSSAFDAARCQPGLPPGVGRFGCGAGAAASSSSSLAQVGVEKPSERRKRAACSAARVLGGVPLAVVSSSGRRPVGVRAVHGQCPPTNSSRRRAVVARQIPAPSPPCSVGVGRGGSWGLAAACRHHRPPAALPGSAGWRHRAWQPSLRCLPAVEFVVSTCCGSKAGGATRTAVQAPAGSAATGGPALAVVGRVSRR